MSKVWLITGASRGLGRALTEAALAAGEKVVGTSRDASRLADLTYTHPDSFAPVELALTDRAALTEAVALARERFGRLDVVVANGGYGVLGALEECSEAQARAMVDTHFLGPLFLTQAALPVLRAQGSGHLVYIGAAAAISNYPGFGAYGGAKAGLETMAESVAQEVGPLGIRAMVVVPGPFRTGFAGGLERAATPLPDYEGTRGKFQTLLERTDGRQPGDPARAALAIRAALEAEKPPLRLVLGKYATDKLKRALAAKEAERAQWEEQALTADFPRGA
jgi:NAD(P)-dependent dehydrogenase (short-subunit alcohol dehydrogenase family)